MKTKEGNHTFSLTHKTSYSDIQNLLENKLCIPNGHDKYHLNKYYTIAKFKEIGVEIQLRQSLCHPSWIKMIVNPSSLLAGQYCPIELFHDVEKIPKVKEKLREILDECGITAKLKDFKLNRFDLTCNEYCESANEVDNRLNIFKKSYPIPRYKPVPFEKFLNDDGTYEDVNQHSWTIACKNSEFSAYDKGYELEKRHGIIIEDNILRLELRLGKARIRQLTKSSSWEDKLEELIEQQDKLMDKFLHRLYQDSDKIVTKEQALQMIEESSFRKKTKTKMCKVVNLTVKWGSLIKVRSKMGVSHKSFKALLDRFRKLGISPITLE